jgi:MOB kinase activator 1
MRSAHMIDISLLRSAFCARCAPLTRRVNFFWHDSERRELSLPAPSYIDYVMSWLQNVLDDESNFPTKSGHTFPHNFPHTARHMYKHLFRIFAHLYHAHFEQIVHLSIEAHFNSLFAHFLSFGKEFELFTMKDLMGGPQGAAQSVGLLQERWVEMGVLEA